MLGNAGKADLAPEDLDWDYCLCVYTYILDIDNRFLVPNAIVVQVRQNGKLSKDSQITCDRQGRYLEAWATKNLIDKVN